MGKDDDELGPHRLPLELRQQHARNRMRMLAGPSGPPPKHTKAEANKLGRAKITAWQDHALHCGAILLAFHFIEYPGRFRDGVFSYDAYQLKTNLYREVVEALKRNLTLKDDLKNFSPSAVRQIFYRRRQVLESLMAERIKELRPE